MYDDNMIDRNLDNYDHHVFIPGTDLDQVDSIISTNAQNILSYIHSNWAILVIIGVVNLLSVAITIQN